MATAPKFSLTSGLMTIDEPLEIGMINVVRAKLIDAYEVLFVKQQLQT